MTIKTIGVVGAGTMGNGIAQVFAGAGFDVVVLVDVAQPMLDRAKTTIAKSLAKFVEKGALTAVARDETIGRITTATSIESLASLEYVIEAIVEQAAAKEALLFSLDAVLKPRPRSSRPTLRPSRLHSSAPPPRRPDRVLGMHPS